MRLVNVVICGISLRILRSLRLEFNAFDFGLVDERPANYIVSEVSLTGIRACPCAATDQLDKADRSPNCAEDTHARYLKA